MKLNKDICEKCCKETERSNQKLKSGESLMVWGWWYDDDKRWEDGKVFCARLEFQISNKRCPEECKYKLEHMVLQQNGSKTK